MNHYKMTYKNGSVRFVVAETEALAIGRARVLFRDTPEKVEIITKHRSTDAIKN